jgi:hypothetical protein
MIRTDKEIEGQALDDGQYAIAYALLQVAAAIRGVGGDLDRVATALNNIFMDPRIERLVQSVETTAESISRSPADV